MSSAHSMNAKSVSNDKSPTQFRHSRMNEARLEEEGDRNDRGQEADGKAANQNKNTLEELKQRLPSS